jgi:N-dimethylarginine dimethylaminohydrolase
VSGFGLSSEYGPLAAVLLYVPGPAIGDHPDPAAIQHLRPIDHAALAREFDAVIRTFEGLGIEVLRIEPGPEPDDRLSLFNMMYCRDLFFMTPRGAILANMAHPVRQREPQYAGRTLAAHGIPLLHSVAGPGRFEGADALWLDANLVIVGVGNRTNQEGFEQVREVLAAMNVACLPLPSRQTATQHLLGSVQLVDERMALVRSGIIDPEVVRFLRDRGFTVVDIPENAEGTTRQAMNLVTVAPGTVIMTAGCPETRRLFERAGLRIAAEVEIDQLINGAGGLACATGIVARG